MRNIKDILLELEEHPDYVGGTIWTREWILNELITHYEYNEGLDGVDIDEGDLTESDWDEMSDMIQRFYDNAHEVGGLPWDITSLDDMDLRIKRKIKLNNILDNGTGNENN